MSDDRDRPKKSWREIDKGRDGSRHRDPRGAREKAVERSASSVAQKSYRAALERAFENGTLGELARQLSKVEEPKPPAPAPAPQTAPTPAVGEPGPAAPAAEALPPPPPPDPAQEAERENRQKLITRIRQAEGRDPITKAIDAFLAQYPKLPDDFEVLTKALSHRDDARVLDTLGRVEALLAREKPRRGRSLGAQLRFLEETHDDPEIRALAARVRAKL